MRLAPPRTAPYPALGCAGCGARRSGADLIEGWAVQGIARTGTSALPEKPANWWRRPLRFEFRRGFCPLGAGAAAARADRPRADDGGGAAGALLERASSDPELSRRGRDRFAPYAFVMAATRRLLSPKRSRRASASPHACCSSRLSLKRPGRWLGRVVSSRACRSWVAVRPPPGLFRRRRRRGGGGGAW
jgi:hypothetical protein